MLRAGIEISFDAGLEDLLALSRRFRRAAASSISPASENVKQRRRCCGRRRGVFLTAAAAIDRLHRARHFSAAGVRRTPASRSSCASRSTTAVCEKLCVPVEAPRRIVARGAARAQHRRHSRPRSAGAEAGHARRRRQVGDPCIPARAGIGGFAAARDRRCRCARAANVDLFAEGPTADWALPLPEPVAAAPGVRALRLRARWPAAGRQGRGRHAQADGGRRRRGDRGADTSRLIRWART